MPGRSDKKRKTDEPQNQTHPIAHTKKEFGARLREEILKRGWTQSDLARRASLFLEKEMGRDSISVYCLGKSLPGGTHLYAIARALDMEPAELLPGVAAFAARVTGGSELEVRALPGMPGRARLVIDQEVSFDQAVKIMQILQPDSC